MRVHVESVLPCAAELAWAEVQKSDLLLEVAAPLIALRPVDAPAFPAVWPAGGTVACQMFLLGFIPLGRHQVHFESIDPAERTIQTRESDPLVHTWDHRVTVQDAAGGQTRYADDIEVGAGPLTPLVWLFAQVFYRCRQRRWRRVARRLHHAKSTCLA